MSGPALTPMSSHEPSSGRSRVVILGNDALVAARPSSPIQVARACLAYGFAFVAPISWGDELIAEHAGEFMSSAPTGATLLLHCPLVASSIGDLALPTLPCCVSVPPPVAAARYVRAGFAPHEVSITYVGGCPGGANPEIDEQFAPELFLARLSKAGCSPLLEPDHFDDMVPPDRSRFASTPGGAPAAGYLDVIASATLREVAPETLMTVARAAGPNERYLLDLASAAECRCARDQFTVTRFEPRRSLTPVVSRDLVVDLRPTTEASLVAPQREIVPSDDDLRTPIMRDATAYWVFDDRALSDRLEPGSVAEPGVNESASTSSATSWWTGTHDKPSQGTAPPSPPSASPPSSAARQAAPIRAAESTSPLRSEPESPPAVSAVERPFSKVIGTTGAPERIPSHQTSPAASGEMGNAKAHAAAPPSRPATTEKELKLMPISESAAPIGPTSDRQFIRRPVSIQPFTAPTGAQALLSRLGQRLPGRSRSVLLTKSPPVSTRPSGPSTSGESKP